MAVLRYEVELTNSGYLYLSADLASLRFPSDALVAKLDVSRLILWPTSGASAGGMILKQRNPAGDRCVLMSEVIPPEAIPGKKEAVWDEQRFQLSIELNSTSFRQAIGSNTIIQEENGRWVVYLEVGFWEAGASAPLQITRSRISDYSTRRDAEVAASWMQRSAERKVTRPVEGS